MYESGGNREGHSEATPLDVGAKGKGKSKGEKGDKRDKRLNCGKSGHWVRDCWNPGGGAVKGLVKSKCRSTGGKGKSGKDTRATVMCLKCGKLGHKATECRKADDDKEVGHIQC